MRILHGGVGMSPQNIRVSDLGGFLHLFDDIIDHAPSHYERNGDYSLGDQQAKDKEYVQEAEDLLLNLLSIKTGCLSVSSPDLGESESPMGDATILPVVTLRELEYLDGQAKLS